MHSENDRRVTAPIVVWLAGNEHVEGERGLVTADRGRGRGHAGGIRPGCVSSDG